MECISLSCQVCLFNYKGVGDFKKHVSSEAHKKKMKEVFQKDTFKGFNSFPFIILMDSQNKPKIPIGPSLLTLCFSPVTSIFFYLCHVCEEKCPPERIANHLSSGDHCSNYFNYTYPNALSFSWVPSMNMRVTLRHELAKEALHKGPGQLQLLDLPENLLTKLEASTYTQVMQTLSENDKLVKLFKDVQPNRTLIQTYQRDRKRKYPLLGMQHLVECICVGPTEKRYYLCTLCNLTLASHMIIRHVLSFDHIFCYFRAYHPLTLMSKECYKDYKKELVSVILDFARQTEIIHDSEKTHMKQVSLEPAQFASVNFNCYAEALKELESISKESLVACVKPGNKLEVLAAFSYKLRCQNCNIIFDSASQYFKHVPKRNHMEMMTKFFGNAARADATEWRSSLGLYGYIKESCMQKQQAIGVSLVVTCVCSEDPMEPIYVCFACEDSFSESSLRKHFDTQKHVINTLLHQNPWRLPFAWDTLDGKALKSMAWEEEKDSGPSQKTLKVLDIPHQIFWKLIPPSFEKVMRALQLHQVLLKREVPRRETFSKLQQNERFPQLGRQFLVMSVVRQQATEMGFLCLLCEKRLSDDEFYAHVFSHEHVEKFLNCFHPGSLSSSTDAETLLDLAKQAACIHSVSHVQVIHLDKPIWEPCTYLTAISILQSAKGREGRGKLKPPIKPGMKLVPRGTLKDVDKGHVGQKNSGMMKPEEKPSQTDNSETTLKKIKEEAGAEITNTHCVNRENAEKGADKEIPTPSKKESEMKSEVFSETCSEEIKDVRSETCPAIKEEIDEPTARKPRGETLESCQNTGKDDQLIDRLEIGKRSESSKDVPTQFKNDKENDKKRPRQEDTCPNEDAEKATVHKRQRLGSTQDASREEPQNEGESGKSPETSKESTDENQQQAAQLWQYVKLKSREPVVGLSALLECHCDQHDPIYLCECCSQKIPEKAIISHITGFFHQKIYLGVLHKLPIPPGKDRRQGLRLLAARFEQDKGYGEAQVVDVDEEIYNNILQQDFKTALETVKAFQALQDGRELPSNSALPAVQPVDTSVTLHAQREVCSVTDNFQVVRMEIDDDSEAQLSSTAAAVSVMTETTSEVLPESSEDVKMVQIKVSKSADKGNTCPTVSRASEGMSSQHGSTSETNTTCLHPDSTGNESKAEIIPKTASKIVGSSQTAATSDPTVTNSTKSVTAVSKCTAKSSISTPDATKSTAIISNLTETASTSKENISSMTPTTRVSRPLERGTGAASMQAAAASHKADTASKTGSTAVPEASCRTAPASKTENRTRNSETASKTTVASQAMVPSGATSIMTKTPVQCENTEASAKTVPMKNSVGSIAGVAPIIPKTNSPAALPPPTEPSHTSARKKKPNEILPIVGLNQLILVKYKKKLQVYCRLCSVRMKRSSHTMSSTHQLKYVKMKYPGWTARPSEFKSQLDKTVARLAEMERDVRYCETIEVSSDVYQELAALPEDKAVERVKAMITQRSSSTADTAEDLRPQIASASPCGASSPDDGMHMPLDEMARLDNQSEQEKKHELQTDSSVQMPVHVEEEVLQSDVVSQTEAEVTPALESPAVQMKKPLGPASRFAHTPHSCQETPGERLQQERRDPRLRGTQKVLEEAQKAPPVEFVNPDPLRSAASVNTEQQNQPKPIRKAEHVPKHPGPGHRSASKALPRVSIERLKTQRSSSTADTAEGLRQQVACASPCHVSHPDDGIHMPQVEMAGLESQSEQQKKHDRQTDSSVQMPVHVEQEVLQSDVVSQTEAEVTPAHQTPGTPESPAVQMEKPLGPASRFAQTPHSCQETPGERLQQEKRDPRLRGTQKVLEEAQKAPPVEFVNPDPLRSAASVNTEDQNQPKPIRKAEHVPKHPGPGHRSASKALPRISIAVAGGRTPSLLSTVLNLRVPVTEPVIGLGLVWECRGMSPCATFYLCESCQEKLFVSSIYQHMVSNNHRLQYLLMQYPQFLLPWWEEDLLLQMKLELLKEIAWKLLERERYYKTDAQVIMLRPELYECVQKAQIREALKMVQNIQKLEKLRLPCLPISTRQQQDQQPEDRQSPDESPVTEGQSAEALGTDQRRDNEARQKTDRHHLGETAMVRDLDWVQQSSVSSPLDVTRVLKADSVGSPFPGVGPCLSPRETSWSLSTQPELGTPASLVQGPVFELQVNQAEVHSESPCSCVVSPKTSQTLAVFPRGECLPTRKRRAVTSDDTLLSNNYLRREEPLPAKYKRSRSLQPVSQPSSESASESTPVNPAATSTLLSPNGPGSDRPDVFVEDRTERFTQLIALVRERKSALMFPARSSPYSTGDSSLIIDGSSEGGVQAGSKMEKKQTRWDSKLHKATVKTNPPSTNSLEGMFPAAAPLGHKNHLVPPNATCAFSANNSSNLLTRGNLMFTMTEAKTVGTMLPCASTAHPSDPQHQRSVSAQGIFGNVSQTKPGPFHPGQIAQPRGSTEAYSRGVCQLPVNAIITAKPNKQFMWGYNQQDHTEVNSGNLATQSLSAVETANPCDTLATSGGYGQYSQMPYFTSGRSGYVSSEAVVGYTKPNNPPAYTGGLYQPEGYTTTGLYPSQIDPEEGANLFGHSSAIPAPQRWMTLTQQPPTQQPAMQQQQQQQQQYYSWTSAALPAGVTSQVTNEAVDVGAAPFTTPANNPQRFMGLNDTTNTVVTAQNGNNVITQSSPQVDLNALGVYCPPPINSGVISQKSVYSYIATTGREFFTLAPSVTEATPAGFP